MSDERYAKDHIKIADHLIQRIVNKELEAGQRAPSVNQLAEQFHVNRNSAISALVRLENQGWLTAIHGKGFYVKKRSEVVSGLLSRHSRYTNLVKSLDEKRDVRLLEYALSPATELESETLKLSGAENVFRLEILRFLGELPISLVTSSLPEKLVPGLDRYLSDFASLYEILEEHYHFTPVRKTTAIEARMPPCGDAELLQLPENIPVLWIKNINVLTNGSPAMMDISRTRGDRYQMIVDLDHIEKSPAANL